MHKKVRFDPPYDSPIEEQFVWHFEKYVDKDVELLSQFEILTSHGNFKMDFVIKNGLKLIGIECDGKDYHHIWRDIWRDIAILENSDVIEVFRFRGSDITYHINECLLVLSWYYSELFDHRGIQNLKILADKEILNDDFYNNRNESLIEFNYRGFEEEYNKLKIWRINTCFFNYEKTAKLINSNPSLKIDQLYEKYKTIVRDDLGFA